MKNHLAIMYKCRKADSPATEHSNSLTCAFLLVNCPAIEFPSPGNVPVSSSIEITSNGSV